jgi:hypothetical protein
MASNKPAFKSALAYGTGHMALCLARIAEQAQLLKLVRSALPTEIAQQATHCVISGNKLIVYTQTAGFAAQIRFYQQSILNKLRESGQRNLDKCQLKLLFAEGLTKTRPAKALPSDEIVQTLIREAGNATEDALSASLLKLGKTLQKRRQNP